MATIIRTEERNGDIIAIYESGAEYNQTQRKLVKGAGTGIITPQNATEYNRKRQEKASRLLRERIVQAHNRGDMEPVKGSAEAFAESGALLYEEIVLDKNAYPRDRMDVWEKLGKYGGILPADVKRQDNSTGQQAVEAVGDVLRLLLDAARAADARTRAIDVTPQEDDTP